MPTPNSSGSPTSHLRQEYDALQELFRAQPPLVQRFLEVQAHALADALIQRQPQIRFSLPDRVVCEILNTGQNKPVIVPPEAREQLAGGLMDRLARADIRIALRQRLLELGQSQNRAIVVSADLLRYTTVSYMIHGMLPSGRSVTYIAAEGEEIPTIPVTENLEPGSAITATTDAIALPDDSADNSIDTGRGELLVPYVEAARRFYLPQWVAFDDQGHMLVNSVNEAEAHIASMQRFIAVLHTAAALAPYIVADEDYQLKRYGMLGQLVNQGRALARHITGEIIRTIRRRGAAQDLNRGLSLSLPYFDDQELEMRTHDFEVIPAGRIMFVPAFVVRSAREQHAMVAQDTRLNHSTRKHLLAEIKILEEAFETKSKYPSTI